MQAIEINKVRIQIKGSAWDAILVTPEKMKELYRGSRAYTSINRYMVFNTKDLDFGTLVHEVFHAYMYECHMESADLTADQREEVAAELLERHILEIVHDALDLFFRLGKEKFDGWDKARRRETQTVVRQLRAIGGIIKGQSVRRKKVRA